MRQPRSVTFLYGGIALALLLVIATVALVLVPPSAPSVAEFAPRAEEAIQDAPGAQSSRFGAVAGACTAGQVCDPAQLAKQVARKPDAPSKREIVKARVRRCVGDPPRQTEDPQSPPCVKYWEGDNGGATARGVTRDEILIAGPCGGPSCDKGEAGVVQLLVDHFNSRYEFYGRTLRLIRFSTNYNLDPAVMRADAERVDREIDAFASLEYSSWVDPRAYSDALARSGIVSIEQTPGFRTSAGSNRNAPYQWSFGSTWDELEANLGEMACRSLAGTTARNAGATTAMLQRRFAVLVPRSTTAPDVTVLASTLARCDPGRRVVDYPVGPDNAGRQAVLADLRSTGVTTLVCACPTFDWGLINVMEAAAAINYQPEWLLPGIGAEDQEAQFAGRDNTQTQRIHMFGIASRNKVRPVIDEPWLWAAKESDPTVTRAGARGSLGYSPRDDYEQLLLLASGIQAAGPDLRAGTFERGLQSSRFANPAAGREPYWQATVGFGPGDHAMTDDLALYWWDETSRAASGSTIPGQYCYIDRGARWASGRWPATEPAFFDKTRDCR